MSMFGVQDGIYDRQDLRVLTKAYQLAIQALAQAGLEHEAIRFDVAELVFGIAADLRSKGQDLKSDHVAELVASQASAALCRVHSLALCA